MASFDPLQVAPGSWKKGGAVVIGEGGTTLDDDDDFFEPAGKASIATTCIVREITSAETDGKSGFPLQNHASFMNSVGIKTDIICTSYADYHMVVITQLRKFGTVIHAWVDRHSDLSGSTYEMSVLLGKREDTLLMVYARQIIQRISRYSDKPLMLAISLREGEEGRDADTFSAVLNKLFEISTWV